MLHTDDVSSSDDEDEEPEEVAKTLKSTLRKFFLGPAPEIQTDTQVRQRQKAAARTAPRSKVGRQNPDHVLNKFGYRGEGPIESELEYFRSSLHINDPDHPMMTVKYIFDLVGNQGSMKYTSKRRKVDLAFRWPELRKRKKKRAMKAPWIASKSDISKANAMVASTRAAKHLPLPFETVEWKIDDCLQYAGDLGVAVLEACTSLGRLQRQVLIRMLRCLENFKQYVQKRSLIKRNHEQVIEVWAEAELRLPLFFFTFKFHQHLHYLEPLRGTLVVSGGLSVARMLPFERLQNAIKKLAKWGTKHTLKSAVLQQQMRSLIEWLRITQGEEYGLGEDTSQWLETPAYLWDSARTLDVSMEGAAKKRQLSAAEVRSMVNCLAENNLELRAGEVDKDAHSYSRALVGSTTFRAYTKKGKTDRSIFKYTWTDPQGVTARCYGRITEFLHVNTLQGEVKLAKVLWFGLCNRKAVSNLTKVRQCPGSEIKEPFVMLTQIWQGNLVLHQVKNPSLARNASKHLLFILDLAGECGVIRDRL